MAAGKIAQSQATDPDAYEFFHVVTNLVKHPANLAINSLAKKDAQPRRLDGMHGLDPGALPVEHHALM